MIPTALPRAASSNPGEASSRRWPRLSHSFAASATVSTHSESTSWKFHAFVVKAIQSRPGVGPDLVMIGALLRRRPIAARYRMGFYLAFR
jgi:hypothetical protein